MQFIVQPYFFTLPILLFFLAGAEAGGTSLQAQHLRRIRAGQLWRPVHQWAHSTYPRRWVSSCANETSPLSKNSIRCENITALVLVPLQWRGQEDRPVWVWGLRVHQPAPHVGGGVRVRSLMSMHTQTTHTRARTYTYSHTLMHTWHGVSVSPDCTVVRLVMTLTCFEDSSCTVERLFAKISLTLSHL